MESDLFQQNLNNVDYSAFNISTFKSTKAKELEVSCEEFLRDLN